MIRIKLADALREHKTNLQHAIITAPNGINYQKKRPEFFMSFPINCFGVKGGSYNCSAKIISQNTPEKENSSLLCLRHS